MVELKCYFTTLVRPNEMKTCLKPVVTRSSVNNNDYANEIKGSLGAWNWWNLLKRLLTMKSITTDLSTYITKYQNLNNLWIKALKMYTCTGWASKFIWVEISKRRWDNYKYLRCSLCWKVWKYWLQMRWDSLVKRSLWLCIQSVLLHLKSIITLVNSIYCAKLAVAMEFVELENMLLNL